MAGTTARIDPRSLFKGADRVHGRNTVATIQWCSAAIGAICGLGQPLHAVPLAAAALCANVGRAHHFGTHYSGTRYSGT